MTDSNEPVNVPSNFNDEFEVKMKECDLCQGECIIAGERCDECLGTGELEMTPDEIRDEMEEKKENQNQL